MIHPFHPPLAVHDIAHLERGDLAHPEPRKKIRGARGLLDAIIERRLTAQGKTLIDAGQIDRLRKAVKDLNAALGGLGD